MTEYQFINFCRDATTTWGFFILKTAFARIFKRKCPYDAVHLFGIKYIGFQQSPEFLGDKFISESPILVHLLRKVRLTACFPFVYHAAECAFNLSIICDCGACHHPKKCPQTQHHLFQELRRLSQRLSSRRSTCWAPDICEPGSRRHFDDPLSYAAPLH